MCQEYTFDDTDFDRTSPIQILNSKQGQYVNINLDGFRGKEFDFQSDDYKIFFLGGSTAFGFVTSTDDFTIPALLEKKLRDTGLKIKVINAGIPSSYSMDERYYIEKYITNYSPDMIIMYDGWNDMSIEYHSFTYDEFKNQSWLENHITQKVTRTGIITFFVEIDYKTGIGITRYFSDLLDIVIKDKIIHPEIFFDNTLEILEDKLQDNWSKTCEMGKESNFKTINLLQPVLGTGNRVLSNAENYPIEYLPQYLIEFKLNDTKYQPCENVYDLRSVFDEMNGVTIYFDGGHVSDLGNEIIAKKIFQISFPIILDDISKKKLE